MYYLWLKWEHNKLNPPLKKEYAIKFALIPSEGINVVDNHWMHCGTYTRTQAGRMWSRLIAKACNSRVRYQLLWKGKVVKDICKPISPRWQENKQLKDLVEALSVTRT